MILEILPPLGWQRPKLPHCGRLIFQLDWPKCTPCPARTVHRKWIRCNCVSSAQRYSVSASQGFNARSGEVAVFGARDDCTTSYPVPAYCQRPARHRICMPNTYGRDGRMSTTMISAEQILPDKGQLYQSARVCQRYAPVFAQVVHSRSKCRMEPGPDGKG